MPLAQASTAVLLLTTANLEGLYHVRDRVAELSGTLGDPARHRPESGGGGDRGAAGPPVERGAGAAGVGVHRFSRPGDRVRRPRPGRCPGLWAGELTRRFTGSDLVRTVRATAETVLATWPELVAVAPEAGDPLRHNQFTYNDARSRAATGSVMEGARS